MSTEKAQMSYVIISEKKVVAAGNAYDLPFLPRFNERMQYCDGRYLIKAVVWDLTPGVNQLQFHCDTITSSGKYSL